MFPVSQPFVDVLFVYYLSISDGYYTKPDKRHGLQNKKALHEAAPSEASYFSLRCSQCWLATLQEVLLADWHEVWHSPHPPVSFDSAISLVVIVLILFILGLLR